MFFYSDMSTKGRMDPSKIWDLDGTQHYLKHYSNLMILDAMAMNPKGPVEVFQIEKEMAICRKKLKWWMRHPLLVEEDVRVEVEKMHKQWGRLPASKSVMDILTSTQKIT